jgi:hypothetical protein
LDCNLLVQQNSVERLRAVTPTTGTVPGTYIPGDSITVQAYSFFTTYPQPSTGTSTVTLIISTGGESFFNSTVAYNSGGTEPQTITHTFSITRGQNYSISAYTTYTPVSATPTATASPTSPTPSVTPSITKTASPTSPTPSVTPSITKTPSTTPPSDPATATLSGTYYGGTFTFNLSDIIYTQDTTISYASISGFGDGSCTSANAGDSLSSNIVISKGTQTQGSTSGNGFFTDDYFQFDNSVTVNGQFVSDGGTVSIGNTTVTVYLQLSCSPSGV